MNIYSITTGLYCYYKYPGVGKEVLYFFDTGLLAGEAHPYATEVSNKVNGKFAIYAYGRLFQYSVVLDPDYKQEVHMD